MHANLQYNECMVDVFFLRHLFLVRTFRGDTPACDSHVSLPAVTGYADVDSRNAHEWWAVHAVAFAVRPVHQEHSGNGDWPSRSRAPGRHAVHCLRSKPAVPASEYDDERASRLFLRTSWSMLLSSLRSATSCLSFRFSSSNCFSLRTSAPPRPAYFFFQR
ncbi:hypothetical protein Enr10x_00970 [Gimesia panareensis]|uniref:Uncharacterized protein n=1 Tax=Gimesia panareensis TaxID=2527978 RepID=A0A518ABY5_9PLAN|nr:hypothetical protein Enr10x_00970 [Gimesia panareensis]QDU52250.1 hypothetical protein Pan110_46230 [Gimesia panareensis]